MANAGLPANFPIASEKRCARVMRCSCSSSKRTTVSIFEAWILDAGNCRSRDIGSLDGGGLGGEEFVSTRNVRRSRRVPQQTSLALEHLAHHQPEAVDLVEQVENDLHAFVVNSEFVL